MTVDVQRNGNVIVMRLAGELSKEASGRLEATMTSTLSEGRGAIVLDMSEIDFIDSKGLESLLWARDTCRVSMVQFRLVGLRTHCHKILEVTRLLKEFHCTNELTEAVKSLV
jgi:anti-sigma B factor antagonist